MAEEKKDPNYISQNSHVFLGLLPYPLAFVIFSKLGFIISFFVRLNPTFAADLQSIDHKYNPEEYVGMGIVSYSFFGALLGFLLAYLSLTQGRELRIAILIGLGTWFALTFFLTYFCTKLPSMQLKNTAIGVDRTLIYALKEMVLQGDSGSSLYESLVAIAQGNYGALSKEFDIVVRQVNTGSSMIHALDKLLARSRSEFFRKAIWQLINTVKTGSELKSSIEPIIKELDDHQKAQIQNYARELNLWSLMYMMFSVAIPTIGSTMLVVLSVFASFGVNELFFIGFVAVNLMVQVGLIFFVKSRRPNVSF